MNTITRNGTQYKITAFGVVLPYLEKRIEQKEGKPFDASLPDEDQVALCMEWLRRFARPRITVNRQHSSYGLKHCVECWCNEYVTNGAFIEAVRRLGYEVIPIGLNSPNAIFRLSFDKEAVKMRRV